jgi:hypothetical protein
MKKITLSANEKLIERARLMAKSQHKTLNVLFREWLEQLVGANASAQKYEALMDRLGHIRARRHFDRDEMNER